MLPARSIPTPPARVKLLLPDWRCEFDCEVNIDDMVGGYEFLFGKDSWDVFSDFAGSAGGAVAS